MNAKPKALFPRPGEEYVSPPLLLQSVGVHASHPRCLHSWRMVLAYSGGTSLPQGPREAVLDLWYLFLPRRYAL